MGSIPSNTRPSCLSSELPVVRDSHQGIGLEPAFVVAKCLQLVLLVPDVSRRIVAANTGECFAQAVGVNRDTLSDTGEIEGQRPVIDVDDTLAVFDAKAFQDAGQLVSYEMDEIETDRIAVCLRPQHHENRRTGVLGKARGGR